MSMARRVRWFSHVSTSVSGWFICGICSLVWAILCVRNVSNRCIKLHFNFSYYSKQAFCKAVYLLAFQVEIAWTYSFSMQTINYGLACSVGR